MLLIFTGDAARMADSTTVLSLCMTVLLIFTGDAARMADSTTLLSLCDSVHLSLVKTEPSGDTTLVSSHHLEWRTVLAAPSSRCSVTLELMGVGECTICTVDLNKLIFYGLSLFIIYYPF